MQQNNNQKRKLFLTFINSLSILFMLVMSTFAWFSMNKKLDSSGMKMEIQHTGNLVIAAKKYTVGEGKAIETYTVADDIDKISYSWTKTASTLHAATHDLTVGTATGLKYVTNTSDISPSTGLATGSKTLSYAAVPTYTSGDRYYIDYMIFIASLDVAITDSTHLYASIEEVGTTSTTYSVYKAASIDLYMSQVAVNNTTVATVSSSNYKGTLHLNNTSNKVDLFTGVTNKVVPVNTSNCLSVLMRCYFDGELKASSSATKTYITTNDLISTSGPVNFNIKFSAE